MLHSLSHDPKKCDTHVYAASFQPLIRRKQLGNWPNRFAKRLPKLANSNVGETTRRRNDGKPVLSVLYWFLPFLLRRDNTSTWLATDAPCLTAVSAIARFILASSCCPWKLHVINLLLQRNIWVKIQVSRKNLFGITSTVYLSFCLFSTQNGCSLEWPYVHNNNLDHCYQTAKVKRWWWKHLFVCSLQNSVSKAL